MNNTVIHWFKPRVPYYVAHIIGYFAIFIITGWDLYPHEAYLKHTFCHFIFSIPLLFIFSFYVVRLILNKNDYPLFILIGLGFIVLSWGVAYYIYPQAGTPRINLPFFITNRFIFFFVPTIIELVIQNIDISRKLDRIQVIEDTLHLNQQITPHLLFNILTEIQYQIQIKSPKAEHLLFKLKDLMGYSMNQATHLWTTLENEIQFLHNYIEVEGINLSNTKNITFYTQCDNTLSKVPSLLFIVFVENAFKYSDLDNNQDGFIEIVLDSDAKHINFQIRNSIKKLDKEHKNSHKIGLQNIKKRLDIIYPNQYDLLITNEDTLYQVNLKLNISSSNFI
jgi:two-component system, LytTR family, sensor kinase